VATRCDAVGEKWNAAKDTTKTLKKISKMCQEECLDGCGILTIFKEYSAMMYTMQIKVKTALSKQIE
jgi:hypothetical protein